jgi:hypothetical protein
LNKSKKDGDSTFFCIKGSANPRLNRFNKERFERRVRWGERRTNISAGEERK